MVNTTDQAKALRVSFLEGQNGTEVLMFNVYLSPYDVWTGALVATTSGIVAPVDHAGEPSAYHTTSDVSCAPFLNKGRQEFLPYVIDAEQALFGAINNSMKRAREGHLEIMEMGVLAGTTAAAVGHSLGVPIDCALLDNEWIDGQWGLEELTPSTGGLYGSAALVNVAEGLAFSYDAIALQNFWQGEEIHTEPGSFQPNLSFAYPESRVFLDNGDLAVSDWSSGYEAVSAVLMSADVYNEYALDSIVAGKSEWVITLPTKKFHTTDVPAPIKPFSSLWRGQDSCDDFDLMAYDRETIDNEPVDSCGGIGTCPPRPTGPEICYSSNVLEFFYQVRQSG